MRPARLTVPPPAPGHQPPLVAVAHGSRDPRAAVTIARLLDVVRSRARAQGMPGLDAREAFLDHCAPSLPDALAAIIRQDTPPSLEHPPGAYPLAGAARPDAVLVPLLLTAAYHSKSDIPAQLAAVTGAIPGHRVRRAATLGPHPLLIAALERRIADVIRETVRDDMTCARTSVVLAAAGSSDPAANETIATLAAEWQASGRWRRVVPGYASATAPSVAEAVRALRHDAPDSPVAVATYLLAPGYFADKIAAQALESGAVAASAPLGAIPEVADVILDRYCTSLAREN